MLTVKNPTKNLTRSKAVLDPHAVIAIITTGFVAPIAASCGAALLMIIARS